MKKFGYIMIIIAVFYSGCKSNIQDKENPSFNIIKTFKQTDNGNKFLYSINRLDSNKRSIELIIYNPQKIITWIVKTYYDTNNKRSLITWTIFPDNQRPVIRSIQSIYDSTGLLKKELHIQPWNSGDTLLKYYYYDQNNKLVKTKSIHTSKDSISSVIVEYLYDKKDRIIKKLYFRLDGKEFLHYDSISYCDSIITTTRFSFNREHQSKEITAFKNKKPIQVLKYSKSAMSENFNLLEEVNYTYDKRDSLIKRIVLTKEQTSLYGDKSPQKTDLYTYEYSNME